MVCHDNLAHALGRGMSLSRMASLDETYKYVTQGTFYVMIISLPAGRHGSGGAVSFVNALYCRENEPFFTFAL